MGHGGRFIFTSRASRRAEEAASTVRGSPERNRNRRRPGHLEMCVNHLLKRPRYFKRLVTHRNGFGNVLYQWFETNGVFSNGRFRTLHKCLVGAQTSCWRVGVMLVRRRLTGLRGKKSGPRRMVLGLGRELALSRDRYGARAVGGRSGARVVGYRFQMSRSDERSCMSQRQGLNASVQRNSLGPRRMTMRRGPRTCHWSAIGARAVGTGSLVRICSLVRA